MSALTGTLRMGRSMAESRMTETITAGSYRDTVDESLNDIRELIAIHYTGPAQVKFPTMNVSDAVAAGQQVGVQSVIVKLPVGAARIPVGDMVVVTASTVDDMLVGREFRVEGGPQSGQVTSNRYPVTELS